MTSTLAQQLKRLSVPGTALSCHGPSKQRASLLFDSKEAANLDRDQVFNIGVNGLTELEHINRNFGKFERILFSQSSMTLDRTLQSKEVNSQLNDIIKEFLAAVSPFFLMKAAQKCLEWLIYRFYIHQMNVDDFILCILPHHDSDMFPRALKLLKLQDPTSTWHFLNECLKMNIPLPRRVLLNRCKKDPGFLSFMCKHLTSQIEKFGSDEDTGSARLSLNFYTVLMLGVVSRRTEINESLVKIVVMNIERGLKSTSRERKAANYMILAQLTSVVVPLKLEVTLRLIKVLLKYTEPTLCKDAVLCLSVILQNQKIDKLSDELLMPIAALLEDLPDDEVCSSTRLVLNRLIAPSEEEMNVDETDLLPGVLNNLTHRKMSRRIAAVKQLNQMLKDGNHTLSAGFICDAFLNRLKDDDHKVVRAVLELDADLVANVDKAKLLITLVDVIETKYICPKWQLEVQLAVRLICTSNIFQNVPGLTAVHLGWLLITDVDLLDGDLVSAKSLISSPILKEDFVAKTLSTSDLIIILNKAEGENGPEAVRTVLTKYNRRLISVLAQFFASLNETDFLKTMADLMHFEHAKSYRLQFLLVASLSVALSNATTESGDSKEKKLRIATSLLKLYESQLSFVVKEEDSDVDVKELDKSIDENLVPWLSRLRETNRVPAGLVQWSILQVISAMKPYSYADGLRADRSESLVSIVTKVIEVIADKRWLELQSRFQKNIDQSLQLKILMMLMSEIFEFEEQESALVPSRVYLALFKMLPNLYNEKWTLEYLVSLPVFPGLILCLQSSLQDIRIGAVRCLQKFHRRWCLSEGTNHGDHLKSLLKIKDVVMVDREFISEVGFNLFRALPTLSSQQKFVSHLVDFVVESSKPFACNAVKNCLKDLKVQCEHVSHELSLSEAGNTAVRKESGKKRAKVIKNLDTLTYRRIVLILEVLEMRKKLHNAAETMGLLFKLLSRLMSVNDEKADHCRQLTLACLCSICKRWESKDLSEIKDHLNKKHLDIESLRLCISDSSFNSQVQQQALTLLAFIAPLYPEYVLTNAVAIFTFMGTSLVQLDNSYTFHVIISTIDAIMSAVVNAQPAVENDQGTNRVLTDLISIFVDARHHIPGHRKLPLFHHLVERVGVEAYLWSLIVLIMDSSVRKETPKQTVEEKTGCVNKDIELVGNICVRFSVDIQLATVTKMTKFLQSLLSALSKGSSDGLLVLAGSPVKSFLGLLVHLTRAILEILSRRELIVEILKRSEGQKIDKALENSLRALILESLRFLTEATRLQGGPQIKDVPSKFWPVLMGKVPKILHRATYLLPTASFLEVVNSLLEHEVPGVRLKSFEILIGKICPPTEGAGKIPAMNLGDLAPEELISLKKLISKLAALVRADQDKCQQMALYSIQLLCARLGKEKPQLFAPVIPVVVETAASRNLPSLVFDVGLTCLSEMCRSLGSRSLLKYLPALMSSIVALMEDADFLIRCAETTIVCLLVTVKEVVRCFAEMLDIYIGKLLNFICSFPAIFAKNTNCSDRHRVEEFLKAITTEMGTKLESRVLLPKALETLQSLLESNQVGLAKFFVFIRLHISERSTELRRKSDDILVNLVELFDEAMNLRSRATQLSWEQLLSVETELVEAIYAMVLPLTDNQFSTVFQKFFSYVATEKSPEYKLRLLTFFHLSDYLCAKLQDLFIKYALHVLTAATEFLVENGSTKHLSWFSGENAEKNTCLMLEYVIGCLHKCVLFDMDGSFAAKCVKKVMLPVVEQLENFVGGEEEYKNRVTQYVVPCIGQLAVAAKKDGAWKDLSYQICLKSRNSSATVRVASLLAIEEMARKLGSEYDALVPETMPFLAELLEDDDNDVVEECRRVKQVIEEIIGELLDDCFV